MNDISTKLLFDGYKSLSSRIDELEFQLKNLRKEFKEIIQDQEECDDKDEKFIYIMEVLKKMVENKECSLNEVFNFLQNGLNSFCIFYKFSQEDFLVLLKKFKKDYSIILKKF